MNDLFSHSSKMNNTTKKAAKRGATGAPKGSSKSAGPTGGYTARDIEVLEGLEPVRRRPGMYIGGVDEAGLHHLAAEVLDNAMDEAVAGFASRIEIELRSDGWLAIEDNGRGIPVDPHPKFKDRSALEVILTTLHAGAKFSDKVYHTAGGLHGVGVSVVNALSEHLEVEVARDKKSWIQSFKRGAPIGNLKENGAAPNRRGTKVAFLPDGDIFGPDAHFRPARLFRMARSKAYLFRGVEIRWTCAPELLTEGGGTPAKATLHFPGGLEDYLGVKLGDRAAVTDKAFAGRVDLAGDQGRIEWAVAWPLDAEGSISSYCNTVPTPDGGTHESGLKSALAKGLRGYGERTKNRQSGQITGDDVLGSSAAMLSVFIREPSFHGQTKEKLANPEAAKQVEGVIRDHFDHWLSAAPREADALLAFVIDRAEERVRRRKEREVNRKAATRKLRLPGKLADCSQRAATGTEILLVEGDSAGGSAKQARDRKTQAVLPLKGKILNVANAGRDKMTANKEISDIILALGCGTGSAYREEDLRYEKVIIMTDADVDGAHIASLLMTLFYREFPGLVADGHLYLALPPLYRITQGAKTLYAKDDDHREQLMATEFTGRGKIEVSHFKGLGEMPASQLKVTTMSPATRTLARIMVPEDRAPNTAELVEHLMGKKPELRLAYILEHAPEATDLDI